MEQYRETCSTRGGSSMTKLASLLRLVFFTLAVPQLLSSCTADSEMFKPVAVEQPSSADAFAQQRSGPTSLPASAAAAPAPRTNMPIAAAQPSGARADTTTDYTISSQDILQIAVFQI